MTTDAVNFSGKDGITNCDIQPAEDRDSLKHGEVAVGKWGSETKREFKSRHLSMLAVGGTTGYVLEFFYRLKLSRCYKSFGCSTRI